MRDKIEKLPQGRYLLGFSGGVDSSALFFLLLENEVEFDIAIVDYALREQSKEEVSYAKALAQRHKKQCFCTTAPRFLSNFESQAREFRYRFFEEIVRDCGYDGLILAHQLCDRFEWMMMQFCKGAGVNTLLGFEAKSEYRGMHIFRPLLRVDKQSLYRYCKEREILFFEDSTNEEQRYLRNQFREILQPLMQKYSKGILQSFEYLAEERAILYPQKSTENYEGIVFWDRGEDRESIHLLDLEFKKRGYLLSYKQKMEILRCSFSCEIADIVIESTDLKIFVLQKSEAKMSREFRDFARRYKIPQRLRRYLFALQKEERDILDFLRKNCIGDFF